MGDFDNDILADPTGLAGIASSSLVDAPATQTADPTPIADTPTDPAWIDSNEDINLEMTDEAIHSTLQEQWGDQYGDRYAAASRTVQEIFHNDRPLLKWFEQRVGNHINVVRLAHRLSAMLDGNRPQNSTAPSTDQTDVELKDIIEPGGKYYDRWRNGDLKLNERRLALYSRKHPQKLIIE
jgi:hypothetical protein